MNSLADNNCNSFPGGIALEGWFVPANILPRRPMYCKLLLIIGNGARWAGWTEKVIICCGNFAPNFLNIMKGQFPDLVCFWPTTLVPVLMTGHCPPSHCLTGHWPLLTGHWPLLLQMSLLPGRSRPCHSRPQSGAASRRGSSAWTPTAWSAAGRWSGLSFQAPGEAWWGLFLDAETYIYPTFSHRSH